MSNHIIGFDRHMIPYTFIPNINKLIIVKLSKDQTPVLYCEDNIFKFKKSLSIHLKSESNLLNKIELLIKLSREKILEKILSKNNEK